MRGRDAKIGLLGVGNGVEKRVITFDRYLSY